MCAGSINYKSDSWTYTEKIWNRKGYTPQIWEAQIAHCKFGSEKKNLSTISSRCVNWRRRQSLGVCGIVPYQLETSNCGHWKTTLSIFSTQKKLMVCDQRGTWADLKLYHCLPPRTGPHWLCTCLSPVYKGNEKCHFSQC